MNDLFIVTGADGHLGNTVVRQLAARGERVRGLVLPQSRSGALDGLDVEVCRGDLLSPDSLDPLFAADGSRRIQVIHTAGIVSIASRRQRQVYDVNVTGTRNLLAACRRHGVRRIVYTSSVHAIPEKPKGQTMAEPGCIDPRRVKGLYAQTKALATRLVLGSRAAGLDPVAETDHFSPAKPACTKCRRAFDSTDVHAFELPCPQYLVQYQPGRA